MKKSLFLLALIASLFLSVNMTAQDNPVANISINSNVVCANSFVLFQDISTDPNGHTINAWLWDFGDGTSSTVQNPTHFFTATGNYIISLTVWNDVGGSSTTQITVTVLGMSISFTTQNPFCFGDNSGQIQAYVYGGSTPYWFQWSNSSTLSTITNLTAGVYSLTVTDAYGCTQTASVSLSQPPEMIVNVTTTECVDSSGLGEVSASLFGGTPPYTFIW